ncbi:MAG: family 20 glycosylhydrolase [Candidatus Firestonebacteria bacterium]
MTQKLQLSDKTSAFRALCAEYPEYFSTKAGKKVEFYKLEKMGFSVFYGEEGYSVNYSAESDKFRALLEILLAKGKAVKLSREYPYEFRALMIDCSRNGVIKEEFLRKIIIKLALLGYNRLCLYTEDTFEVKGEPEWGYKRGKYSKEELKRTVNFARQFGITMFPCIQTLGHLEHILKFPKYAGLRDNKRVLNVKMKEVYRLIEKAVDNAVEPYETDLIHIGMDETWGLGRGNAFEINKKIDPRSLYLEHMSKVAALCEKRKLMPIMWGDIVIGMSGEEAMNSSQSKRLPKNMEMNFWNYYNFSKSYYLKTIKQYRKMGFEPLLSPGCWNWNRFWPLYGVLRETLPVFMEAGRELGVKKAMLTMWGDDGQECPWEANLPGLALFAEYLCSGKPSETEAKKIVRILGRSPAEDYILPSEMDYFGRNGLLACTTMAKLSLYEDPLLGLYSLHFGKHRLRGKYDKAYRQAGKAYSRATKENRPLFAYARAYADALRIKVDLRNEARSAYLKKNKRKLIALAKSLPGIYGKVETLWNAHRKLWLLEKKPFGLEALDLKYGGVLARLKVMQQTLEAYTAGKTVSIPEFDERDINIYGKFPVVKGLLTSNVITPTLPHE